MTDTIAMLETTPSIGAFIRLQIDARIPLRKAAKIRRDKKHAAKKARIAARRLDARETLAAFKAASLARRLAAQQAVVDFKATSKARRLAARADARAFERIQLRNFARCWLKSWASSLLTN
jgi:hypothetical protein